MTESTGDLGIKRATIQVNMILKWDTCYEGEVQTTARGYSQGWSAWVVERVRKSL